MQVFIYRNPKECPFPFAEVQDGYPVHPGELQTRVRELITSGKPWATLSKTVISILGWMIRRKELSCPLHLVYVPAEGEPKIIRFDIKGDLIEWFPEEGYESIEAAEFHYHYDASNIPVPESAQRRTK